MNCSWRLGMDFSGVNLKCLFVLLFEESLPDHNVKDAINFLPWIFLSINHMPTPISGTNSVNNKYMLPNLLFLLSPQMSVLPRLWIMELYVANEPILHWVSISSPGLFSFTPCDSLTTASLLWFRLSGVHIMAPSTSKQAPEETLLLVLKKPLQRTHPVPRQPLSKGLNEVGIINEYLLCFFLKMVF